MRRDKRLFATSMMLVAIAASGAVAAGCGGDGDGGDGASSSGAGDGRASNEGGSGSAASGVARGGGPAYLGNQVEARKAGTAADEVYERLRGIGRVKDGLVAPGGGDICDLMSAAARRQTIEYARRSSGIREQWTCETAVGLLVGRSQRTGGFKRSRRATVLGVNAQGNRATASIRFGKRGAVTTVPLVKEGGEWKLGAAPSPPS